MGRCFEIHQGEWTYTTNDDSIDVLATANVAQCTVFCGRASNGFSFMFHIDWATTSRVNTFESFGKILKMHVPVGSRIDYHLTGGWSGLWSQKVRDKIYNFMHSQKEYNVIQHSHPFNNTLEPFYKAAWKKGVSYNLASEKIEFFHVKAQTKRKPSFRAAIPFCEMILVRPELKIDSTYLP